MAPSSEQIQTAITSLEVSIKSVCQLLEQWRIATKQNPTNLTKKQVDQTEKNLKNKVLTVKWDCEDLEELIEQTQNDSNLHEKLEYANILIRDAKEKVAEIMDELEGIKTKSKILNKHGISIHDSAQAVIASFSSGNQNSSNESYKRLSNDDNDVVFDRGQIQFSNANVYANQLHDYYEYEDPYNNINNTNNINGFNPTEVFNSLSKPLNNSRANNEDNETILGMLETEYYDPPLGLQVDSSYGKKMQLFWKNGSKKLFGTITVVLTFLLIRVIV